MIKDKMFVGDIQLKNRIVKAPIYTNTCVDGQASSNTFKHYEDRTGDGRFGMVMVEHTYVRRDGIASPTQLSSSSDKDLEGLKRIADIIHKNDSIAILQLNHAGCDARIEVTGCESISASNISVSCGLPTAAPNPIKPRPLTKNEILAIEDAFYKASERALKAGFDGVNIHSAHAYLLNQFYSPITNKRIDEYNGYTLEGRTRIHREILKGVRQIIGSHSILALRIGGCDYRPGGTTIEDSVAASKIFEQAGADLIDISGGLSSFVREGHTEPGYFGEISEAVKKAVTIPVLLTGGIKTLDDAEMLLQAKKADLIGVGRIITANANWGKELLY